MFPFILWCLSFVSRQIMENVVSVLFSRFTCVSMSIVEPISTPLNVCFIYFDQKANLHSRFYINVSWERLEKKNQSKKSYGIRIDTTFDTNYHYYISPIRWKPFGKKCRIHDKKKYKKNYVNTSVICGASHVYHSSLSNVANDLPVQTPFGYDLPLLFMAE